MENTEAADMKATPVPGPSGATLVVGGFNIDPYSKQILRRRKKKSQGSSSYIHGQLEEEIGMLPSLDGA